ncbi:ribonuclease H1-like isoform 1, partial [Aphelenchoides avenae]
VHIRYATYVNEGETTSRPKGLFEAVIPLVNDIQLADTSQSTFVYTAGHSIACGSKGKFFHGAYGVHWPDKPELNKSVRITAMPTPTRCQLNAIVMALEQAVKGGVKDLVIVTDDRLIPTLYNNEWLRANGQRASNYSFYERMRQLGHKLKLRFVTNKCAQVDSSAVEKARKLAAEGLAQVRPVKQPRQKKKNWAEVYSQHLEATAGLKRPRTVHVLTSKAGSGLNRYCATLVNGRDNTFLRMTSGRETTRAALVSLTDVLEKATDNRCEEIVIRTNRVDIAKALVMWLPERRECGFLKKPSGRNSGSDEFVTNATYYKKIAELMDCIKVRVEVIEDLAKLDPQVDAFVKSNLKLYATRSRCVESTLEEPSAEGASRQSPEQVLAELLEVDECIEPTEVPELVDALVGKQSMGLALFVTHGSCFGVLQDIDEDRRDREGIDTSALRPPFVALFEEVPQHFESLIDSELPAIHLLEPTFQMHSRDVP